MDFFQQKQERLQHADLSRKGSIDECIVEIVDRINSVSNYFTTSSCSGRIIILESIDSQEESSANPAPKRIVKKGCKWLFVSHEKISMEAVEKGLMNVTNEAVFKFEPMIMHIQCQSLKDAQILAVRSTHGLEVPLSSNGVILVSQQYLGFLVDCANKKMDENFARINRFLEEVKLIADGPSGSSNSNESAKKDMKQKEALNAKRRENKEHSQDYQKEDEDFMDHDLSLFVFENT